MDGIDSSDSISYQKQINSKIKNEKLKTGDDINSLDSVQYHNQLFNKLNKRNTGNTKNAYDGFFYKIKDKQQPSKYEKLTLDEEAIANNSPNGRKGIEHITPKRIEVESFFPSRNLSDYVKKYDENQPSPFSENKRNRNERTKKFEELDMLQQREMERSTTKSNISNRLRVLPLDYEPSDMEVSRYYVKHLISDTKKNRDLRDKLFEKEMQHLREEFVLRKKLKDEQVFIKKATEKENVSMEEIKESFSHVMTNLNSLMGMGNKIVTKSKELSVTFKRTISYLESKVTSLQKMIEQKDKDLTTALKREESITNQLENALEEAIIREHKIHKEYNIPITKNRFLPMLMNHKATAERVKTRFKNVLDFDNLAKQFEDEQKRLAQESNKVMERLTKEHNRNMKSMEKKITTFKHSYSKLLKEKKKIENRLAFYQKDKKFMKKFEGPRGNVTLVFTDVQSSTELWEWNQDAMGESIILHNKLIRYELDNYNGYEVKTEGDAFMCAFENVVDAVDFCLKVQLELLQIPWSNDILGHESTVEVKDEMNHILFKGLRVRMGIHSGNPIVNVDPVTHRDDYFGPMVNRAARVESFADGGEIIISEDSWNLLTNSLSKDEIKTKLWEVYLGKYELKGIEEPMDLRRILPAELRSRVFGTESERMDHWKDMYSWSEADKKKHFLFDKMKSLKIEIDKTLKVNSLQNIIQEKDMCIKYLLSNPGKNSKPENLENMMKFYNDKINDYLSNMKKYEGELDDLDDKEETTNIKLPTVIRSKFSHASPTSSSTTKRKKKKKRVKVAHLKQAQISISSDEYDRMQHNIKYLKLERDQAVKKQKNLAVDLMDAKQRIFTLAKEVDTFKKKVQVGGSFGIAVPNIDYKEMKNPKIMKSARKKKKKHKRILEQIPSPGTSSPKISKQTSVSSELTLSTPSVSSLSDASPMHNESLNNVSSSFDEHLPTLNSPVNHENLSPHQKSPSLPRSLSYNSSLSNLDESENQHLVKTHLDKVKPRVYDYQQSKVNRPQSKVMKENVQKRQVALSNASMLMQIDYREPGLF